MHDEFTAEVNRVAAVLSEDEEPRENEVFNPDEDDLPEGVWVS